MHAKDKHLNKERNRYLIGRLKPVTVCIAAICDVVEKFYPKIVLCADRLVTAGIQFEGGESKVKKITNCCYAMHSSNDSLASDLILEKVKARVEGSKKTRKVAEIIELLKEECLNHKKEYIERDILFKYNLVSGKLGTDQEPIVKEAVEEVEAYEYPLECEFIIAGFDSPREPHIFRVDQDGNYSLDDSLGFTTIGSGGGLVFLELTKHGYSRTFGMTVTLPRVYIAKKISERAEGVGRYTDIGVLYYHDPTRMENEPSADKIKPTYANFSHPDFLKKLDKTHQAIQENERKELDKLYHEVYAMLTGEETEG